MSQLVGQEPAKEIRSKRPVWKRLLFSAVIVSLVLGLVELLSYTALRNVIAGSDFERLRLHQNRLAESGVPDGHEGETIHPYLGWVHNPQANPGEVIHGHRYPVTDLGLVDDHNEIPRRSPDRLIVGVLGGSVAWQMSTIGEAALRKALQESEAFRDREIRIVHLALSGYKQPQQLMALNYFLALGAEFDVVVNVDGYNEIALPACENEPAGVSVAYPRMWHVWMQNVVDPRSYSVSYQMLAARAARQASAKAIVDSPLRFSATRNLIWKLRDNSLQNQINEMATSLAGRQNAEGRPFHASGPVRTYADENELLTQLVELWKNCSLQLHRICEGNRTIYLHVLQPNQYHADSKPMGDAERKIAFVQDQEYGLAIRKAYPMLIAAGGKLRDDGVRFHDESMLFASIQEPIYIDPFCHFNQQGNDLLATAVARLVIQEWNARPINRTK